MNAIVRSSVPIKKIVEDAPRALEKLVFSPRTSLNQPYPFSGLGPGRVPDRDYSDSLKKCRNDRHLSPQTTGREEYVRSTTIDGWIIQSQKAILETRQFLPYYSISW